MAKSREELERLAGCREDLFDLALRLRRSDIEVTPAQLTEAHDLLLGLRLAGLLPSDRRKWRPYLAPIFCRSAEEQAAVYRIFPDWLAAHGGPAAGAAGQGAAAGAVRAAETDPGRAGRPLRRRWLLPGLGALMLLWIGVLALLPLPSKPPDMQTEEGQSTKTAVAPGKDRSAKTIKQTGSAAPPVRPPETVPPTTESGWSAEQLRLALAALPVAAWAIWLVRALVDRRRVLTREPGDAPAAPHTYWVRGSDDGLFDPVPLRAAGGRLRAPVRRPTRRVDVRRTVAATVRRAGLFTPVCRSRRVHPEYLILLDRALPPLSGPGPAGPAPRDHLAAYGESLIEQLRAEQVICHVYIFDRDPRRCRPSASPNAVAKDLGELEALHGDARLILLSDAGGLFEPFSGMPAAWLEDFRHWAVRMLLTPRPAGEWGYPEATLALKGFAVAPVHPASLALLADEWLPLVLDPEVSERSVRERRLLAPVEAAAAPLPRRLQRYGVRWLAPEPPDRARVRDLLAELRRYLGDDGFRLLQALAVYPELTWPLTLYLDWKLRPAHGDRGGRASRLLAVSRLPWLRYGRIPDYLRLALVRSLSPESHRDIMALYQALLDAADREGRHGIALHIDPPPKRRLFQARMKAWFQRGGGAYGDRIFAKVLLGRTPRWLDVELPDALARWLPGSGWSDAALTALIGLAAGVGLAAALLWLGGLAMPWVNARLQAAERARFGSVEVTITGVTEKTWLAAPFADLLRERGFVVTVNSMTADSPAPLQPGVEPPPPAPIRSSVVESGRHLIIAGRDPGEIAAAHWIADRLRYLSYGQGIQVESGVLDLLAGSESGRNSAEAHRAVSVWLADSPPMFQDPLGIPAVRHVPETVTIPAGTFMMGSPKTEQGRYEAAAPQHKVRIASFALGRYEVSFDEYDEFARATGRDLPDDQGWGRGQRPVINVSWEDAKAYAEWLSQQTGQRWRLPSEAEWEYAARSGRKARRYWGDDPKDDQACAYANVLNRSKLDEIAKVYQGAKDWTAFPCDDPYPFTAPVGRFTGNAYGLQDTLGNVWEWVEDCWHDSYEGAPGEGSAWVSGDCDLRVLRGGSWRDVPDNLRAANRPGNYPALGHDFVGFRLARDLP